MSIAVHSTGDFVTGAVEYGAQAAARTVVEQIKVADSFLHSTVQAIATALPKNNTMLKVQHRLLHNCVPAARCGCYMAPVMILVQSCIRKEVQQVIITQLVLARSYLRRGVT